jgi:UDP-N-acetyl-2-amino-2-deoxyglucuronate dehydrogenase
VARGADQGCGPARLAREALHLPGGARQLRGLVWADKARAPKACPPTHRVARAAWQHQKRVVVVQPVRLGIIGCGVIGKVHLEAAVQSSLLEVVAVADLDEARACAAAERFGVPRVYTDGQLLLADPDVEAVVLALPACARTSLALRAFERGKHVLTEKPVAMNAAEVRQMIAARGELVAGCCSSRFRFLPAAQAATDFIATGALGPLRLLRCRAVQAASPPPQTLPPAWRLSRALNAGGILANWGCYDLDYLLGLTGWILKPRLVLAQTWTVPPQFQSHLPPGSDAETHAVALIRCEDGAVIALERGEYMAARSDAAWEIIGTAGSLRLNMLPAERKQLVFDEGTATDGVASRVIWEGDEDASLTRRGPVEDFAAAIRTGHPPKTTLEQALVVQQITDAIYAAAEQGKAVEIADL